MQGRNLKEGGKIVRYLRECENNYKVLLTYIKLSKINLIIVKCHQFSQLFDQSDQPN